MDRPDARPEWADRLRRERDARGWTQEDVVRAMRTAARRPLPDDLLTTYKRYERGRHFPAVYAPLLAEVYGTSVESLFGSRRRRSGRPRHADARDQVDSTTPIDEEYVNGLRGDIKRFVRMDQRHGGNRTSAVIVRAVRQAHKRMAHSEIRKGLSRDLHAVVAELAEVAGWSLYDADEQDKAERLNNEALKLARLAGDRSMELFVLQNMSMQAGYLGRARESLNIAQLVLEDSRLSSRLRTLFTVREARALAQLGAEPDARQRFSLAQGLFLDGVQDSDPAWAWWVDEHELAWHQGMIELDLGKVRASVEPFQLSADGISGHRMRTAYHYRASATMANVINESWLDAEDRMRALLDHVGLIGSRRTDRLLERVLTRIDRADAPDTVHDLASALRTALIDAA